MQVLFCMTASGTGVPGGHQTQITQTAAHLEALGVHTRITHDGTPDLTGIDIVHNFGLKPEHMRRIRDQGVPIVTSTIYWNRDYAYGLTAYRNWWEKMKPRFRMALVLARSAWRGQYPEKCEALMDRQIRLRVVYELSDLLLPNSQSEADAVYRELGVSTPYHVAPNAVDPRLFTLPEPPLASRAGAVYVGRFEPHKNQMGLIQAMRGAQIPVHILATKHPHHERYYLECQRLAAKCRNVTLTVAPNFAQLRAAYQQARVHVLPSWFETTGLVSLEAALCGCNIVTTQRGFARDYFGDQAWYCDPGRPASIRTAIEAAHAVPYRSELRERILNRFTWRQTAAETLAGYQKVLHLRRAGVTSGTSTPEPLVTTTV